MKEQRRQQYLDEMGITLWRPHTLLPGAKPSLLVRRTLRTPNSLVAPDGPSSLSTDPWRPKQRTQTAASILTDHNESRAKPATSVSSPKQASDSVQSPTSGSDDVVHGSRSQEPASATGGSSHGQINSVFIAEAPGDLLIVDASAVSRDHQQLVRNLMFAITDTPMGKYRFTPIDPKQLGPAQASISELAFGVVERSIVQNSTQRVLLLGGDAVRLFDGEKDTVGELSLPGFSNAITTVASHSSESMLKEPSLKRETWAHVQCLRKP